MGRVPSGRAIRCKSSAAFSLAIFRNTLGGVRAFRYYPSRGLLLKQYFQAAYGQIRVMVIYPCPVLVAEKEVLLPVLKLPPPPPP